MVRQARHERVYAPPPFVLSLSKDERNKWRMERSLGKNQPWFDKLTTNESTHPPPFVLSLSKDERSLWKDQP